MYVFQIYKLKKSNELNRAITLDLLTIQTKDKF